MADVMKLAKVGVSRQGSSATPLAPASTQGPESSREPERESAARAASRVDTASAISPLADVLAYQRDLWERWILFIDTLRQRADDLLAHDRAGKPPLLDFDYELILDARRFERPANYALLRITRLGSDCIEDCLDPSKPPVIIVDRVLARALVSAASNVRPKSVLLCMKGIPSISSLSSRNRTRARRSPTCSTPCAGSSRKWQPAIPGHRRSFTGTVRPDGRLRCSLPIAKVSPAQSS
jgi:hypothetical protein